MIGRRSESSVGQARPDGILGRYRRLSLSRLRQAEPDLRQDTQSCVDSSPVVVPLHLLFDVDPAATVSELGIEPDDDLIAEAVPGFDLSSKLHFRSESAALDEAIIKVDIAAIPELKRIPLAGISKPWASS